MKTQTLIQGSPDWRAYRAQHFNASDAPAMMGCSPYKTRAQLLRELHTGLAAEVDAGTQRAFDNGHRFEALARPLAESIIGEDLYPVTGSEGRYSASFDGLTLGEDVVFEHKTASAELRAILASEGSTEPLPLHYRVQMEQQLMVSGAGRALFMATLWDGEVCTFSGHRWYEADAELRAAIIAGWQQFAADLAAYVPPAAADPAPVGKAPDTLPALRIELTGMVTASNLAEFKQTALGAIRSVNRNLQTDQDFADAEKAVKWCADVEARLKAAKEHALSQTASIDELFRTLDDIAAESKAARLDLDKLVTRRKTEVKEEAVAAARRALDLHIAAVNSEVAPMRLLPVVADFPAAIKGKRSIDSMQDALDVTLANAKIAADQQGRAIRANVAHFHKTTEGMEFLFSDLATLVHKSADDFEAVLAGRIRKHLDMAAAQEKQRQADEAERIAAAERRAAAEAEARVRAEQETQARREREAAEADRRRLAADELQAAQQKPEGAELSPAAQALNEAQGAHRFAAAHPVVARQFTAPPAANEPAALTLGMICERLQFTVRADFLADALHVSPAKVEGKRPGTYTESQFRLICRQLQSHVGAMAELYAAEVVS